MDISNNTRWKQRFENYKKALVTLTNAINLSKQRTLSDLEKQGLIQGFEFTHELAWKTLKDFFRSKGVSEIYGSKDATKTAFQNGIITNGEAWFNMIESRNLSSHTYDTEISDEIVESVIGVYHELFIQLEATLSKHD